MNKNTASVENTAKAVESHNAAIEANTKAAEANKQAAEQNAQGIAANKQGIAANKQSAEQNAQAIRETQGSIGDAEFRKQSVQQRLDAMNKRFDTVGGGVSQDYVNNSAAKTLKQANDYTDKQYNKLDGKIKKLRGRADAGIAGSTAIATLPFSEAGANSVAGGLGVAKDKVAGAIGYQHNFGNQWRARATVAASDNYVQGGAGVGYSW